MKVENDSLIVVTKQYFIVEKILVNDGKYTFQNILSQKLNEMPFKILYNYKIAFYNKNILKIYQFSMKENYIQCLFKLSYDILEYNRLFKANIEEDEQNLNDTDYEDHFYNNFYNSQISNELRDIIEIKEKNLIIISFLFLNIFMIIMIWIIH